MTSRTTLFAAACALGLTGFVAGAASAAEHEIHMLDKGADGSTMVFEPSFLKAEPGDVIHFIPVDKGHNVESIKGMLPEGVDSFKGKINDPFDLTVTADGLYGIKCTPHFGMGMVALIQVGDGEPANLEAVKTGKMPKTARERMDADLENVK